jgi:hypothetical protein
MSYWRSFWRIVIFLGQQDPCQLVEALMLSLALLLFCAWMVSPEPAYLLLGLIYVVGYCVSILVRQRHLTVASPRSTQLMALLLLGISLYGFADVVFAP